MYDDRMKKIDIKYRNRNKIKQTRKKNMNINDKERMVMFKYLLILVQIALYISFSGTRNGDFQFFKLFRIPNFRQTLSLKICQILDKNI